MSLLCLSGACVPKPAEHSFMKVDADGQNPDHVFGEEGDGYTGDPAQELQGLNSVFATDSTVEIIWEENRKLGF